LSRAQYLAEAQRKREEIAASGQSRATYYRRPETSGVRGIRETSTVRPPILSARADGRNLSHPTAAESNGHGHGKRLTASAGTALPATKKDSSGEGKGSKPDLTVISAPGSRVKHPVLICETVRCIPGCEIDAAAISNAVRGALQRALCGASNR
jgi:hypothetical protein